MKRRYRTNGALTAIVVTLAAVPGGPAALAQEGPERAPLKALIVQMKGDDPGSRIFRNIWSDAFEKELEVRRKMSATTGRPPIWTTDVFAAEFKVPGGGLIVSATDTPDRECETYSNLGLSPSLMTCPMRVALVRDNEPPRIIYKSDHFAMSVAVTATGEPDTENSEIQTLLTFDPVTKVLRTRLVEAKPRAEGVPAGADNAEIHLDY